MSEDWPVHRPEAPEAPIPGRHWYAGCEPAGYDSERGHHGPGPRVDPDTGICEGCGASVCAACGRENCPDHSGRWVAGVVLYFRDGGEPEETILHRGTLSECERAVDLLPAVSYSGARPVDRAEAVVVPEPAAEAHRAA